MQKRIPPLFVNTPFVYDLISWAEIWQFQIFGDSSSLSRTSRSWKVLDFRSKKKIIISFNLNKNSKPTVKGHHSLFEVRQYFQNAVGRNGSEHADYIFNPKMEKKRELNNSQDMNYNQEERTKSKSWLTKSATGNPPKRRCFRTNESFRTKFSNYKINRKRKSQSLIFFCCFLMHFQNQ